MKSGRIASLLISAGVALSLCTPAFALAPTDFEDYDSTAWHAEAMAWAVNNKVMVGNGAGQLEPDRYITRAEFVTMVDNLFHTYQATDITRYIDVQESDWFYSYIAMGVQMGTITGISDTEIDPLGNLTREQAMTILARTLALPDGGEEDLTSFADTAEVSSWAIPYVGAMVKDGRVVGRPENMIAPVDYVTRAETAQMLMNCFSALRDNTAEITGTFTDNVLVSSVDTAQTATIRNAEFQNVLLLSPGMADGRTDIYSSTIDRMVCWGNHDVYIYSGCKVNEIVISRTEGPCIIHWMGDATKLPTVIFRDGSDDGCMVVDKNGNQLLPEPEKRPSSGSSVHYPSVTFDPQNGKGVTTKRIDADGYIQPIEAPVKDGYVFGGWYLDKEGDSRFSFTQKATDGMTLYAKWYTPEEWEQVQLLNDIVNAATARIQADTDIMATVGGTSIPCSIYSAPENPANVKVELVRKDTGAVVAQIESLAPGATATEMALVGEMPAYGNYEVKLVVTPEGETGHFDIEAMLYVAYMWDKGA